MPFECQARHHYFAPNGFRVLRICSVIGFLGLWFSIAPASAFSRNSFPAPRPKGTSRILARETNGIDVGGDGDDDDRRFLLSADSVYFDIAVANQSVGRLVFRLTNPSSLPVHAENLIGLAKGSRRGIDPKAHYVGCEFDFSPASVEDGMGRYRWSHQLKGRGRNAVGRPDEKISDPSSQASCCHSTYGGQYYGDLYEESMNDDPGVLLTVPVVGPGYGGSKFSIVRVGESPKEWKETLLLNSGVIGKLDPSSLEVLHTMARQRSGPPTVVAAGVLEVSENDGDEDDL